MAAVLDQHLEQFEEHRQLLFGVAYRMLGTAAAAEDALQDAWLRWQGVSLSEVRSTRPYLISLVTRLCLDELKSARRRREQYPGTWLPEPVPTDRLVQAAPTPEETVEAMDSISYAFMVLLERLGPVERAVFLLRDVFDYDYGEIARVVGRNEATCRQTLHRARERLSHGRERFASSYDERLRLTREFVRAAGAGDLEGLLGILAEDISLWSDGGGRVAAALNPIHGRDRVMRLVAGVAAKERIDATVFVEVNGQPAAVTLRGGRPSNVFILETTAGQVQAIHVMRNPDKLEAIAAALQPTGGEGAAKAFA
jgi:RNA polymerase sigma-70 factor (ECF subfamily)